MAMWTEMSDARNFSRNRELERFSEENKYSVVDYYGLLEDININNCYGVEDVYGSLDEWN